MPDEIRSAELFYRDTEIADDVREKIGDSREFPLSFSSENGVDRWYGKEYLSHHPEHMDLSRMKSLLKNHNPNIILGRITSKKAENGRAFGTAKLDETRDGEVALTQVKSGSLRGVSIGYVVKKFKELAEGEEFTLASGKVVRGGKKAAPPVYVAVKWQPIEASLTPIPADASVGVGRAATRSLDGIEIERPQEAEAVAVREEDGDPPQAPAVDDPITENPETEKEGGTEMTKEEMDKEMEARDQAHLARVKKIREQAAAVGLEGIALGMLADGRSDDEITSALFAEIGKRRGAPSDDGGGAAPAKRVLDTITDEALVRGLSSPALLALD